MNVVDYFLKFELNPEEYVYYLTSPSIEKTNQGKEHTELSPHSSLYLYTFLYLSF